MEGILGILLNQRVASIAGQASIHPTLTKDKKISNLLCLKDALHHQPCRASPRPSSPIQAFQLGWLRRSGLLMIHFFYFQCLAMARHSLPSPKAWISDGWEQHYAPF
jgi:hypothetical protein